MINTFMEIKPRQCIPLQSRARPCLAQSRQRGTWQASVSSTGGARSSNEHAVQPTSRRTRLPGLAEPVSQSSTEYRVTGRIRGSCQFASASMCRRADDGGEVNMTMQMHNGCSAWRCQRSLPQVETQPTLPFEAASGAPAKMGGDRGWRSPYSTSPNRPNCHCEIPPPKNLNLKPGTLYSKPYTLTHEV